MSNSKNDLRILLKIFDNFIAGLSSIEYSNLIDGKGTIKYIDKKIPQTQKAEFDTLLGELAKASDTEEMLNLLKKDQAPRSKEFYINLCRYLGLDVKQRDAIVSLFHKIIEYIIENRSLMINGSNKKTETKFVIQSIATKLDELQDPNQAAQFLSNHEALKTKSNLLQLSRIFDVYIERDLTNEEIIEKIVDSVVVAKLRSLAIRKKSTKSFD